MTKELLRLMMSENRLSSLAIPTIKPEITRALDYTDVTETFTVQQFRRKWLVLFNIRFCDFRINLLWRGA
jgi:hypothetical protein